MAEAATKQESELKRKKIWEKEIYLTSKYNEV